MCVFVWNNNKNSSVTQQMIKNFFFPEILTLASICAALMNYWFVLLWTLTSLKYIYYFNSSASFLYPQQFFVRHVLVFNRGSFLIKKNLLFGSSFVSFIFPPKGWILIKHDLFLLISWCYSQDLSRITKRRLTKPTLVRHYLISFVPKYDKSKGL